MFIDYMPFLILGLIGIDRYFNNKGSLLFTLSIFLIIMTSYYYSIGSILCLVIYGVYKYISINKKITIKDFLTDGFKFLIPIFIGILMSSILLVPTALTLISNRSETSAVIPLKDILIPNFSFEALLYNSYGMGFTCIALISLIYVMLNLKREKRFLSTILFVVLCIPIFMYILNGTLYLRAKVFIPFSPLIILLISIFLNDLKNKKITISKLFIMLSVIIILSLIFNYNTIYFFLDLLITTIVIILSIFKNKKIIYIIILLALCSNIAVNKNDEYISKDTYNYLQSNSINNLLNNVDDNTFYRSDNLIPETSLTVNKVYNTNYYQTSIYSSTYNSNYKNFYENIINSSLSYRNNFLKASTNNIMFETLMGIKYIITSSNNVPIGYNKISGNNKLGLYKNDNVLTLGYSTSSIMSKTEFDCLSHPYTSEALLNNIIVDKKAKSSYQTNIKEIGISYDLSNNGITKTNDGYKIKLNKEKTITFDLDEKVNNKILFVSFTIDKPMKCKDGDIRININNITNTLTCKEWLYFNNNYTFDYVISSNNEINKLKIALSKGSYEIKQIKVYTLDYEKVMESTKSFDKFIVDKEKTNGDIIEGSINVTNAGYFATTIPYDKGFTVYLDGKKISYEMVNGGFIGFPINKGTHIIKMVYTSPGYKIGLAGSIMGLLLFACAIIVIKKRK
jgi:uncharacterized membrane protein YfhO